MEGDGSEDEFPLIVGISILFKMSTFGGLQVIEKASLESQFYGHKNYIGMDWGVLQMCGTNTQKTPMMGNNKDQIWL